ncbi:3-methyladenine DNA glycosylase AlkC [Roseateles sp. YR242]|uniref:DNA alkylation repair protein n=1 Tax=Roseateles sp. YR242 TaxID=1855305 RepID=UPI0008C5A4CA|nr:DNA alkylation repair protein [Roseateles sp. YR242]SEL88302.1 3-methyladenine DNA glycosylase AlkC [Roseateles sp. YR242]
MPLATSAPLLKELINPAALKGVAALFSELSPSFDRRRFLAAAGEGLDELSILQRVHRVAQSLALALPGSYAEQLALVVEAGPRLSGAFLNMALGDFVATYGLADPARSLKALKRLTPYGTAEFAVRPFLRQDLTGTLRTMEGWAQDRNEHVRRLASEGCRPRLPWSFRLDALVKDPTPLTPILHALRHDSSLYVRRSVANSLNDVTKDHPDWVFTHVADWEMDHPHCTWIVKHALRSQIKKGDPRALRLIGASDGAEVAIDGLSVSPARVALGGEVEIAFALRSVGSAAQRLVVDYVVHYVKKNGSPSPKVFKLKTVALSAGETTSVRIRRALRNFTTRVHYAGEHRVDVVVNGQTLASGTFTLTV